MIHPDFFPFFRALEQNNSKAWFNPRKAEYKAIRQVFEEGLDEMAVEIAEFDDRVERFLDDVKAVKVFRIYKDSRFSKSEVALKTNISGYVTSGPEGPFYYVQVGPDDCFVGGGIYQPSSALLQAIREEVAESYEGLTEILADEEFKTMFPEGLSSEYEVKTAPRGFSVDDPAIAYLRKKSFTVRHHFTDEEAMSDDFYEQVIRVFEVQHRLHRYLARAFGRM
ncbi:DUF2461 domain-containing protein [Kiritimatiellota bacterium B12222]|nr:DUF2461 domain-containing protein [Kiritimatiellota bacterium B12222]